MEIFQHMSYKGIKDAYTTSTVQVKRNNDASSFKLPAGCCIEIFDEANFNGSNKTFCKDTQWLGDYGWNDKLSSFKLVQGDCLNAV